MINENDSPLNPLENQGKIVFPDDRNLMNISQYLKDVQQSHKRSIPPLDQGLHRNKRQPVSPIPIITPRS